jgi:hypothetical protein
MMRRALLAVGLGVVLLGGWLVWSHQAAPPAAPQPEAWCDAGHGTARCQPGDWLRPDGGDEVLELCDFSKTAGIVNTHVGVFCRYVGYRRARR